MNCPLCLQTRSYQYFQDRKRTFFRCLHCDLVFVRPDQLPSATSEKARYQLHQNQTDNQGYLAFLQTVITPLLSRVQQGAKGLDFGSGPEPELAELLRHNGLHVEIYDPFFATDTAVLQRRYDFVTCVETAEHFHAPRKEWQQMRELVRKGGWIGIKTSLLEPSIDFATWYYKEDFTHVCFYSKNTLYWLAEELELKIEFEGESVVFFNWE